jgi:hypothetical protein
MRKKRLCIEGNNGGDYLLIEPTEDNLLHLKVGSSCVVTIDAIVPVEFITHVLSDARDREGGIAAYLRSTGWPLEFREQLCRQMEEANKKPHPILINS